MRGSKIGWVQDEVDGVLYDPIPACDYMLLPEPDQVREHADEAMAAAADRLVHPAVRIARHVPGRQISGDHHAMSARAKSRRPPTAVRPQDPPERSERWRRGTRATESQQHKSGWRIRRDADGSYTWTSPTKHTYRYRPPELPAPEPPPPPPTLEDDPPPF